MRYFTIVLLIVTAWSTRTAAERYDYVRWVSDETLSIEQTGTDGDSGQIVVGGDAYFEAKFCPIDSDYHCFFSIDFAFAVPKGLKNQDRWTCNGVTFEVVRRQASLSVFAQQHDDLLIIRSPEDATGFKVEPWLYVFSRSHGLLAFGSEDLTVTYWLKGRNGFGRTIDK